MTGSGARVLEMEGRVALVTGSSRGIGLGIAKALVGCGAAVCLTARKEHELDAAVEEIDAAGRVIAVRGSTDDAHHRQLAVARTVREFGRLDVVVNNAATNAQFGPLIEADLDAVRKTIEANTIAPLGWIQEAYAAWMKNHGGSVLNISSVGAFRVGGYAGAYNISKVGVQHLTKQLALELGPRIRVNCLAVGLVRTHFSRALLERGENIIIGKHPMKRLGLPEDIAAAAVFLLSDAASWITGQVLTIDGGGTSLSGVGDTVTELLSFSQSAPS